MSPGPQHWKIAVVGAGPAGLALALQAARQLPAAEISLFDARPLQRDVSADPRTLALSLGSVQMLQRLRAWPDGAAAPITEVHVSQAPPTLDWGPAPAELRIGAAELGVDRLGAVLSYGALVSCLQQAWLQAQAEAGGSARLRSRFGLPVTSVRTLDGGGAEVDAGIAEGFDLAVVAEGGVFAEQARKALVHDYGQTAWVGTALLDGATPGRAIERFTRDGPVALLPLPPLPDTPRDHQRAALVWCVPGQDDPVAALDAGQRLAVLNHLLPAAAGRVLELSPLKHFALGLNAERTLSDGAVVRIGNAAQTLHPVAGQGLNLGLRDAWVLVDALRRLPAGAGSAALPGLLRRLEWSRGPDRWSMIAATDFLARSFTWRWPGLPAARGLGLAALQALPPLRKALARQMMFGRR